MGDLIIIISNLEIDSQLLLGVKIIDESPTFVITSDETVKIPIKPKYLQRYPIDLKLSMNQKEKNSKKGKELISQRFNIDQVVFSDFDRIVTLGTDLLQTTFRIQISWKVGKKVVKQKFDDMVSSQMLLQQKKNEIYECEYVETIMRYNNDKSTDAVLASSQQYFLRLCKLVFQGMIDDYNCDEKHIRTLAMYSQMFQRLYKTQLLRQHDEQDKIKVLEIINILFDRRQSLAFQSTLVPVLFSENSDVKHILRVLQTDKTFQRIIFVPISIESENLSAILQFFRLFKSIQQQLTVVTNIDSLHSSFESNINSLQILYLVDSDEQKFNSLAQSLFQLQSDNEIIGATAEYVTNAVDILNSIRMILDIKVGLSTPVLYPLPITGQMANRVYNVLMDQFSVKSPKFSTPKLQIPQELFMAPLLTPLPVYHPLQGCKWEQNITQQQYTALIQKVQQGSCTDAEKMFFQFVLNFISFAEPQFYHSLQITSGSEIITVWTGIQIDNKNIKVSVNDGVISTTEGDYSLLAKVWVFNTGHGSGFAHIGNQIMLGVCIDNAFKLEYTSTQLNVCYDEDCSLYQQHTVESNEKIRIKFNDPIGHIIVNQEDKKVDKIIFIERGKTVIHVATL